MATVTCLGRPKRDSQLQAVTTKSRPSATSRRPGGRTRRPGAGKRAARRQRGAGWRLLKAAGLRDGRGSQLNMNQSAPRSRSVGRHRPPVETASAWQSACTIVPTPVALAYNGASTTASSMVLGHLVTLAAWAYFLCTACGLTPAQAAIRAQLFPASRSRCTW